MPNGTQTQATGTASVPFTQLHDQCRRVHTFKDFPNLLFSVPTLCDHDYAAFFTQNDVKRYGTSSIITETSQLQEHQNTTTKLLELPFPQTAQRQVNYAHRIPKLAKKLTIYHQRCGSMVKDTWIKAIKNNHFVTWPGLTAKSHMNQQKPLNKRKSTEFMQQQLQLTNSKKVSLLQISPEGFL